MKSVLLITSDNAQMPSFGYKIKKAFENNSVKVSTFNYRFSQFHRLRYTNNLLNKFILAFIKLK